MNSETLRPSRPACCEAEVYPSDPTSAEFQGLVRRARAGDAEASRHLFNLYQRHVLRAIRPLLHRPLNKAYEEDDLAQEAWLTVFLRVAGGTPFQTPAEFRGYLTGVARNQVLKCSRDCVHTAWHSLAREAPLTAAELEIAGGNDPSAFLSGEDQWDFLLGQLAPVEVVILTAVRAGDSCGEAADRAGVSHRTVQRLLALCLVRVLDEENDAP